ncbi:MAG: hypothetical protein G01um10145_794 [Microgenomates group bacterium Gr01-1014_5]|nr:MAG: hypothetical protein G01um10145_794 [Microgenomates group bacterium Gr01-1014_5]
MAEQGEGSLPTQQPIDHMRTERPQFRPLETGQGDPTRSEQSTVDRALAEARDRDNGGNATRGTKKNRRKTSKNG